MNLILSIVAIIIAIVGATFGWVAFLNDNYNWIAFGIQCASLVIPGIIKDMYEDNLRTKYEYPNRKKEIIFEGTTYKKNTFQADNNFKGYVPSVIIIFIGSKVPRRISRGLFIYIRLRSHSRIAGLHPGTLPYSGHQRFSLPVP